jgi:hypothetical protein
LLLTSAAWGIASFVAWQQTTDKLDKLFDTQQLLFARRLSAMNFDELHTSRRRCGQRKRSNTAISTTMRWLSLSLPPTAKWCLTTAKMARISSGVTSGGVQRWLPARRR